MGVLAAVDIGSNTVHLLIAQADSEGLQKISESSEWLGLGEIVGRTGEIGLSTLDLVVRTLREFKRQAKVENAGGWYVFGTEALRKASNSKSVLKRLRAEIGVSVDLITSDREAELGLRGASIDSGGARTSIFVEVGGGSAQIAEVRGERIISDKSLPIGTGALSAKIDYSCPCDSARVAELRAFVEGQLHAIGSNFRPERLVVSGGVGRGLWRALHPDGDRWLRAEELDYLVWSTQRLTPEEIIARFRVKPKRAATLLPGSIIFQTIMNLYKVDSMLVSRFGVREGAILEMNEGKVQPCPL
jgi:exopolyphosphatase/guanosine-5'-triphosphate,3'-diphosphate pyrophosphatase